MALRGGSTVHFSGTSIRGYHGIVARTMPLLARSGKVRRRISMVAAASKSFTYPPMTQKPRWWLRTLACVPYLLPLHEAWIYAASTYKLHSFLEKFEFLADPFLDTLALLPNWFMMVLLYIVYLGVVRRKELPRFLRFHVVMAMLLSLALQATAIVCGWMPGMVFRERMAYLWIAVAFVQMFTVLKCMQCSLCGMDADVPFMSDAANINLSF